MEYKTQDIIGVQANTKYCTEQSSEAIKTSTSINESDISIEEPNTRSTQMLNSIKYEGATKVRRVSSGTVSDSAVKNDKKQGRGRQIQHKKRRKHRESSSSSSESSRSRSSSPSLSSSSSESNCEEDYHYCKESNKTKNKSSPTVRIEKIHHKCNTKKFKEDIISSVTNSIMRKLDGAILQSFVVPNGITPQTNEVGDNTSVKLAEKVPAERMRYQHQNVVCDHCKNEIFGPRYKCGNCSDYDLCEKCEAIEGLHTPSHVFLKMHFPAALVGRRSVGGKSRPLLRANIYEGREKERESEDLLQRKLDPGSEFNQKVMEKLFGERKTKTKEVEQTKETCDAWKEEWKKMKKEIKKSKKELAKKIKQQEKMMQRNIKRGVVVGNKDEQFCFDDHIPIVEDKVVNEPIVDKEQVKVNIKTHDDKASSALSSLQIIQGEMPVPIDQANINNNVSYANDVMMWDTSDDNASINTMTDLTTDSDGVMVVHKDFIPPELNAACHALDALNKLDLVDFHREVSLSTTASDDFILVSNYFDLTVPIDDKHLHEHRNCESCRNCSDNLTTDFIEQEPCTSSNELAVDLVASSQPDIVSVSTVDIMGRSTEKFPSVYSTPPISLEPLADKQSDKVLLCQSIIEPPSLNEDINDNSQDVINNEQQNIENVDIFPPVVTISVQEQTVDMANPIVQSQIAQEKCILNTLSLNSFEAARTEICDLHEEAIEESRLPNSDTSNDDSVIRTSNGGFTGALVGAMANIVDTVSQAVQSARGSQKTENHNGEVEVIVPIDPRVDGMQKLLDMGFFDRAVNERLLAKHNNDVGLCVGDLIAGGDNQWHQSRH